MKKFAAISALALTAAAASAASLVENFDNVAGLAGAGWTFQNNSVPVGTNPLWFQGNTAVFAPQATNGYVAANFNATAGTGTISTWLITPNDTWNNGDTVSFWTRNADPLSTFPDRMQVRFGAGAGANPGVGATSVGAFTTLLLDINPTYGPNYPTSWTQYTLTISGLSGPTVGRLAFRYFVENGGPTGANSDYIGLDTLEIRAVPTPGAAALLGIAGLAGLRRRR